MKPSTDGDGYKSVSTKRGLGGGNILPWAIFVLASAHGWPSKVFNNHALNDKNHQPDSKNHWRNIHMGNVVFFYLILVTKSLHTLNQQHIDLQEDNRTWL
jgi:hypothetical protein